MFAKFYKKVPNVCIFVYSTKYVCIILYTVVSVKIL